MIIQKIQALCKQCGNVAMQINNLPLLIFANAYSDTAPT